MEEIFTYDEMDRLTEVKMGNDSLVYTYGYGHQRIAMEEHAGNTVRAKRYVGACERVTETMGSLTTDRWLTYLSGPFGVFALVERRQGVNTLHYILKDHLGSWTTVTDSDGTLEQRLSYDAWGNLRDPNTWSGSFTGTPMFDRGFTGHEHLYNFGLINMNGRMYDPMMSSFLSVDRYVQDPTSALGFNRYAYCMYNPLRFVDPTGWYMGAPISKAGLIREYLSDPCYITRQQLREAGMYDIEGGYGWSGGYGAMSAGWMEGDGSFHSTEWGIQTEGGGFEAGAWAIPTSFNPMWVNECQGYCNYGDQNYEYGNSSPTSHATLVTGSGRGGGRSLGLSHHIKAGFQEIISSYIIRYNPI
jgi:RHS repeat-associated protein